MNFLRSYSRCTSLPYIDVQRLFLLLCQTSESDYSCDSSTRVARCNPQPKKIDAEHPRCVIESQID